MRLTNAVHEASPWRIREIVPDFTLEDVWALPIHGHADDFHLLVDEMTSFDPAKTDSIAARILWVFRDMLGRWLDRGEVGGLTIPGTSETSLSGRLPAELRETATDLDLALGPFVPLYCTDREFAAEISNRTVHGVIHLGWVDGADGRYQGQMAIYVKPRGLLGHGYMTLIKPFRYLVVYPALMRQIEHEWNDLVARKGGGGGSSSQARRNGRAQK